MRSEKKTWPLNEHYSFINNSIIDISTIVNLKKEGVVKAKAIRHSGFHGFHSLYLIINHNYHSS